MSDRSDIERVREQVDLVALISEYLPLKPKGREWVGVCPFHDDHKPSMSVVTHKGNAFYKCFSCGASGDCFKFVQEYLKKDFGEALRFLADRTGVELSNLPQNEDTHTLRKKIRKAMEWSLERYTDNLSNSSQGAGVLALLKKRGFQQESIKTFSLGVSPESWTFLSDLIGNNDDRIGTCLEAGLLKRKENTNRVYDTFRNRIMFPIFDESGSPIAFGGRRINDEDEPKYINSPETELFSKSKTLYGYHIARPAIQSLNKVMVVEGYTDVIGCHQVGVTNVVATLGTALTTNHAEKLSRICDEVILVFDGDEAGQRAADRAVEVFFAKNIDVKICVLPEGKDPADLASDSDTLLEYFNNSVDVISYKLARLDSSLQATETISGKSKRIDVFIDELVRLGVAQLSGIKKNLVYEKISNLIKINIDEISAMIDAKSARIKSTTNTDVDQKTIGNQISTVTRARRIAEYELLGVLLFDPIESSAALREEDNKVSEDQFVDLEAASIAKCILHKLYAGTTYTMQEVLSELDDSTGNRASSLYFIGQRICEINESVMYAVKSALSTFINTIETKAITDEVRELKSLSDPAERAQAAQQTLENIRKQKNRVI
jgi:DNA primase